LKTNQKPLILVTNDDGINAPGINALIEVAREFGDVVVVAPQEAQSAMSHAITLKTPLRFSKVQEIENVIYYKTNGTPADCVKLAFNQILERKPDLVLSGINHGTNSSISVIYSGTVSAAIEACIFGLSSIAFSLCDFSHDADFTASKIICRKIIENALKNGIPKDVCLNVNIPKIKIEEIKGIRISRQASGLWQESFVKCVDPYKQNYYWLTGEFVIHEPEAEETDEWALNHNFVSLVPVQVDMTAHHAIENLKKWNL